MTTHAPQATHFSAEIVTDMVHPIPKKSKYYSTILHCENQL
jgi:hypothetical protein